MMTRPTDNPFASLSICNASPGRLPRLQRALEFGLATVGTGICFGGVVSFFVAADAETFLSHLLVGGVAGGIGGLLGRLLK